MPASAGLCTLQPDMQQGLVDVLDSMWNARDVDGMLELFSDDAVVRVTPPLPLGFRSTFRGKQAVRKALERITKGTSIQSSGCQSTGPVITWRSTISSRGWGGWGPAHIEFEAQLEAGKMASVLVRRGLKEAPVAPDATQQAAPAASEPRRAAPLRTDRLRIGFFSHHRGGEQIDDSMLDARPLGGTETAVLRTSRALRDMGHEVRLYQDPEELNRLSGLDVLVIKHLPLVFDRPVAARTYLWSSDDIDDPAWQRAYEPGYRDRFVASMDGIFALSKYHAGRIASLGIPEQKILVLRYGIDPALFDDLGELDEASRPPRRVHQHALPRTLNPAGRLALHPSVCPRSHARGVLFDEGLLRIGGQRRQRLPGALRACPKPARRGVRRRRAAVATGRGSQRVALAPVSECVPRDLLHRGAGGPGRGLRHRQLGAGRPSRDGPRQSAAGRGSHEPEVPGAVRRNSNRTLDRRRALAPFVRPEPGPDAALHLGSRCPRPDRGRHQLGRQRFGFQLLEPVEVHLFVLQILEILAQPLDGGPVSSAFGQIAHHAFGRPDGHTSIDELA